jgi:hypothetical protein
MISVGQFCPVSRAPHVYDAPHHDAMVMQVLWLAQGSALTPTLQLARP